MSFISASHQFVNDGIQGPEVFMAPLSEPGSLWEGELFMVVVPR